MEGRFCVVTGASRGIGLETARGLVARGAAVRITGRDPERLERARDELAEGGADVVAFAVDFSSLAAVRRFSRELLLRGEPLHVLIHNAGVWHPRFRRSRDGVEDTFAVNHLAPFLLTHRLLDRMIETEGESRVVHVSSRLHAQAGRTGDLSARLIHAANVLRIPLGGRPARLDLAHMEDPAAYDSLEAYARSKLAQTLFAFELARRLEGVGVTSHAVHPGSVQTDVFREQPTIAALSRRFGHLVLKTPAEGARTSLFVATDPSLEGVTGRYFADRREATPSPCVHDPALREALWQTSAELCRLRFDETPRVLRSPAFYPA